jgi:hypothetical protein
MSGPISGQGGRRARLIVGKSCLPTSTIMKKRDCTDCSWVQFFLGWWPILFNQEWWGHIRYGLYGSPAVCCWRKPIISKILGHNRRPTVPRVLDPDTCLLLCFFLITGAYCMRMCAPPRAVSSPSSSA